MSAELGPNQYIADGEKIRTSMQIPVALLRRLDRIASHELRTTRTSRQELVSVAIFRLLISAPDDIKSTLEEFRVAKKSENSLDSNS